MRKFAAVVVLGALAWSGCGDAENAASSPSAQARRGRQLSNTNGCASCHGTEGQGGVGPTWIGLAGSERELDDGSVVVADEDYLLRAILEPEAEVVPGWSVRMPTNGLTRDQALDIVAYIESLDDET